MSDVSAHSTSITVKHGINHRVIYPSSAHSLA